VALRVPRALAEPWDATWPLALRALTSLHGVAQLTLFAVALQSLLLGFFVETWSGHGAKWWAAGRLLELAWVLFLARRAALGFDPFGLPGYGDLTSIWLGPLPRSLAGFGLVAAGAAVVSGFGQRAVPLGSPWTWALAALTLAALPPSLVAASVEGEGITWPVFWTLPAWWRRLGANARPLLAFTALAVAATMAGAARTVLDENDPSLERHLLPLFLARLVEVGALAALGTLAGHLVFTRATELGHGEPKDDLVPILREAPTGTWRAPEPDRTEEEKAKAARYAPIALEDEPPGAR
jgi:hypothetical protein